MKYILGNWKSNKSAEEVKDWFIKFGKYIAGHKFDTVKTEAVIFPPFIHLQLCVGLLQKMKLPLKLGAQNVSAFHEGAYTGEVTAKMLRSVTKYVIIGHSERRKYFHEEDQILPEKVKRTLESGIIPVYCIQDEKTYIPQGVKFVAYEPVFAIGSGTPDSPQNADSVGRVVKSKIPDSIFIYGGSVTPVNITGFLVSPNIDGVLPGKASLDPLVFGEMISNASSI